MRELHTLAEAREHEKPYSDGPGLPQRGFFCSIFEQPEIPLHVARGWRRGDQVMDKLSGNILLVDDDEAFRYATTKILESAGFTVSAAPDHREALEVLEGRSPVDLLVTDVIFPGQVHGLALARMARMRRPGIKTLYLTGFDVPETEAEALGKVLRKPISNEQLISEVRLALAG
jgi:CheY-like chemotaxis protein